MIKHLSSPHSEVLEQEEWRNVVRYEGVYEVSNLGRVRRIGPGRGVRIGHVRCLVPNPKGYPTVGLNDGDRQETFRVHSLVAAAFLGPCPPGHEVNHIDRNRANCRLSNLEYTTHRDNVAHSANAGVFAKKMTPAAVREIRASTASTMALAKRFGVGRKTIRDIVLRRTWGHLGDGLDREGKAYARPTAIA